MDEITQIKNIYEKWLANQAKASVEVKPVEKKAAPKKVEKAPVKISDAVKKTLKKKAVKRPVKRQGPQRMPIKKVELQAVENLWSGLPSREVPLIRNVAEMFGVDPSYTVTRDIEIIRELTQMAIERSGSSDPKDVIGWLRDQMAKNRIAGEKPWRQLRVMLRF